MKYTIIITLILFINISVYGAFENVDYGARSLGMGSAYVSVADDANSIFWNTSGIANIKQKEIGMSYMQLYDLVSYSSLSYAQNIKDSSIGIGIISSTDIDGIYNEMEFAVCYAKNFLDNINLGAGIKYLSSEANTDDIKIGNGKGVALDTGGQYRFMDNMITFGAKLRNFIGFVAYNRKALMDIIGEKYMQMPDFSYGIGISADIDRLLPVIKDSIFAIEIADNDFRSGFEYTFKDILSIRTGLRFGNALNRAITTGFGVKVSAIRLDYAYVSSSVGAETSQFSVSIAW